MHLFLLATRAVEYTALSRLSPIRPFVIYTVLILIGIMTVALDVRSSAALGKILDDVTRGEAAFFLLIGLVVALIAASLGGRDSSFERIAIWPSQIFS